jgi:CheY-like chemotaxis protein
MQTDLDPPADVPRVVALAADLIFSSRIQGTAQVVGVPLLLARNETQVLEAVKAGASIVLLDLDARAIDVNTLIRELRALDVPRLRITAFVSHVRADAIEAAREAGAHRVIARSAFVRDLPAILVEAGM